MCNLSIEITQKSVYNDVVIKDSPISTQPVVSPLKHKGAVAAGETANIKITKEIAIMSTIEITSKVEALKDLEALIEEAKAEAEALRDEIKQEMLNRDTEEMEAGQYIIHWTFVLSQRFDTTAFKKVMPEIYKAYTKQTASRRFTIA